MRKHRLLPIISVVLSLILLLHTVSPLVVSALDLISAENTQLLSESCQILDFVDEEVFQSGNHIARLPEEETLSSYAFLNSDGSKTIYYLNENVKYYDTSGTVQEKNIALSASANGYNVTQNDVQLSIPTDLAQGLGISYAGYDISLIPQGGNNAATTQQSGNSVAYINYYGQNTALLYTPGYSGIKEDILLASYTGISSFSFLLNTDGLRLYSLNEKLFLSDAADSEMRIWLGDVVAYDFQGRPSKGSMSATAITEAQQYMLTIQIEEAFLTSESTVYPVVIDPSLTVSDATHGANAIEDAPIYSGYANTNHGSYIYDMVGYVDSNYGIGRTVIRPTGFLNSSVYQNIEFYQINSVIFYIKDATGSGSAQVNLHDLTGSLGWTESTVTWNNVGSYNSRPAATATVGNGSMAAFDITGLVRDWKGKTNDEDFGFVLIHANEASSSRSLIACEGSSSGSMPYIAMNYITINRSASVREGATKALDTSDLSGTITWSIDSGNSSGYASVSPTGVVTGISAGTVIIKAYTGGTLAKTYTVYVTLQDGIYRIQNLNAGRYLGVRGGVFQNGSAVELQNTLVEYPAKLQQYWHLTYLGDGCYNITPMFAGYKALYYSSYNSSTYLDSLGGSGTQWAISSGDEGYLIHMAHDDSICLMASNGGTAAGTTVTAGALSDDTSPGEWYLERQTNMLGAILCDTDTGTYVSTNTVKYMEPDTTESIYSLGIRYHIYSSSTDPTYREVWSSNNTAVAQVNSQTGEVTAVSPGTATIQATVTDDETEDGFPLSYTLQVLPHSAIYDYIVNVEKADTKTTSQLGLSSFISQQNPTGQTLTWRSSDSTVATVNASTGAVTGVNVGEATITASVGNYEILAYTLVVPEIIYNITCYYDASVVGDQTYINNIATAIHFVNTAYYRQFKSSSSSVNSDRKFFAFVMSSCSHDTLGPLDACKKPPTICTCYLECDKHHTNVSNISQHYAQSARDANNITVLWSNRHGSTLCTSSAGAHTTTDLVLAYAQPDSRFIHIHSPYADPRRLSSMCLNLAHEIAHIFGMEEKYDYVYPDGDWEHSWTLSKNNTLTETDEKFCCMQRLSILLPDPDDPDTDPDADPNQYYLDVLSGESSILCESCVDDILDAIGKEI